MEKENIISINLFDKEIVLKKSPVDGYHYITPMEECEAQYEQDGNRYSLYFNEKEFENLMIDYLHERFKRDKYGRGDSSSVINLGAVKVGEEVEYQFEIKSNIIDQYLSAVEVDKRMNEIESSEVPI